MKYRIVKTDGGKFRVDVKGWFIWSCLFNTYVDYFGDTAELPVTYNTYNEAKSALDEYLRPKEEVTVYECTE